MQLYLILAGFLAAVALLSGAATYALMNWANMNIGGVILTFILVGLVAHDWHGPPARVHRP